MAVYNNDYNRRPRGCSRKWAITITYCIYLLFSMITCKIVTGERLRHHHTPSSSSSSTNDIKSPLNDDIYVSQLKVMEQSCPNCLYKTDRDIESKNEGKLRLEAIKRQILSKLGLRHKPNVTHSLPRDVIIDILSMAEDASDFFSKKNYYSDENISTTSARTSPIESMDFDDFYGRTSEIISFAEQGSRVNQNRLLEFQVNAESGQVGQEFRVRTATLWLKADIRPRRPQKCRSTDIYVFKIISRLPESVTLSSQEFDRVTADPISYQLNETRSGWQKIDLTDIVQNWLTETDKKKNKLRLLVDCSCCSNWRIHTFNNNNNNNKNNNNNNNDNRPFLVIRTDPAVAKRVRRRALDCSPDSGDQCCKERFYVNFTEIGWDNWVIAPKGYYANYCRGDCGDRTPDTYVNYHVHIIEQARKTQHLSGMQPCCAPLKFSSMSLIYQGLDSTIIKRDLPKMVVDECGCP